MIGMSIYILIVQAYLNKLLMDKFNDQKRELRRAFGWEEYNSLEELQEKKEHIERVIKTLEK